MNNATISHGFWMAETETTQEFWKAVAGFNPSEFQDDNSQQYRVETNSWNDCDVFIFRQNSQGYAPSGWKFSLTTDAQWEYACRAGTTTLFYWGDKVSDGQGYLNAADECGGPNGKGWTGGFPFSDDYQGTSPVGKFIANAWNLSDMLGNVSEWVSDCTGQNTTRRGLISIPSDLNMAFVTSHAGAVGTARHTLQTQFSAS